NFGKKLEIRRKVYDTARNNSASISVSPKAQDQRVSAKLPKVILFVHWLSKRKGADMIVPTIKHLLSDFPSLEENLKLKVIGDGPYKKTLIEEIKDNKLEKFIEVLGGISNKDIIQYYQEADIFFMPSMEEGFPRVLLEAMAMGVPYVASEVGSVREISCETAQRFLVKSGDVAMFAHKIEALISDKETYEKFKEEELEKVQEYSMDKVIDKFINIISESTN
ncbi:MAG: glycosyltransferase, partial [Candidatus Omnitrophota bacterium]|nr:glycosyltransferase [Candidatus Omnitrophota bacterium]